MQSILFMRCRAYLQVMESVIDKESYSFSYIETHFGRITSGGWRRVWRETITRSFARREPAVKV